MAASALRKLAAQTLRFNTLKQSYRCIQPTCKRNIHISSAIQQLYFTNKHEWIDIPDGSNEGTVGITNYAQEQLGDVVYVQLPEVDQELEADGECGALESVKAASEMFSPVSGVVTQVNTQLEEKPGLVNTSPQQEGWIMKLTVSKPEELETLMNEEQYNQFVTETESQSQE